MTEHEKLHEVCDKIGYESRYDERMKIFKEWTGDNEYRLIDVREIIFTQEFMDKFIKYYSWMGNERFIEWLSYGIICKLNDPVDYLYNLITNE